MSFPKGFLFGTATSALQVEGGNVNSDWWDWEHDPNSPVAEPVGDACDHYHRYAEDIALMGELGLNAYRFTVEWSRIEPERDRVSHAAIAHYRRVLQACHDNGITPYVSLQHFTLPRWVARAGGWQSVVTPVRLQQYAAIVMAELGDLIKGVFTIVEPNVMADNMYMYGVFPPGLTMDTAARDRGLLLMAHAHAVAREYIKSQQPDMPVGLGLSMLTPVADPGGEERVLEWLAATYGPYLDVVKDDDFLGIQCYSTQHIGPEGPVSAPRGIEKTQMGWEFVPEAPAMLARMLHLVAPGLPIIVSENGIATADDTRRVEFVQRSLAAISAAIDDGVDIRGYLHWSFLDNYEWNLGFAKTFGLVGYDPVTFERHVKPSARVYGDIARAARV